MDDPRLGVGVAQPDLGNGPSAPPSLLRRTPWAVGCARAVIDRGRIVSWRTAPAGAPAHAPAGCSPTPRAEVAERSSGRRAILASPTQAQRFLAAALPPLRPAAFFCAVVPPWLASPPLPEDWPPCLDALGELAILAARSLDMPLSFRASYCSEFLTFDDFDGIGGFFRRAVACLPRRAEFLTRGCSAPTPSPGRGTQAAGARRWPAPGRGRRRGCGGPGVAQRPPAD